MAELASNLYDVNTPSNNDAQNYVDTLATLRATFASGRTQSFTWRQQQLQQLAKLVNDNQVAIGEALYADLGKSETESWISEIGYVLADIKHTLSHLKKWMKPQSRKTRLVSQPAKSYVRPEPLGTVLIMGAWNYPFQLLLAPYVAALAAGNCAILKPSELSANTAALISRLIPQYLDSNAVAVIEGGVAETTELLALPFDKIFYTGGEQVGKIVMAAAAKHLTPVTLELGGKSPCIIDQDADIKLAARRIVWGKYMNVGQTCVAPDYLIVHDSVMDEFVDSLKHEIKSQYGDDLQNNKDYGRIINQRHAKRLVGYLEGQEIAYGGQSDVEACFLAPTLVINPSADSALMQEEIFGPILPIISVSTRAEMFDPIFSRAKPLAAYIFTNDKEFEQEVVSKVSAGSMCINDTMMFMVSHDLPFGGVGNSGMGSYHDKSGFDGFSHQKAIMKRSLFMDAPIRYAPFSKLKLKLFKMLG